MANAKQQAPPPPVGFTGEIKRPPLKDVIRGKLQDRHARRLSKPPRPFIQVVHAPTSSSTGRGRRRRVGTPTARRYTRRRPRKGMLFAVLSVAVATVTLTLAVTELAAWSTAGIIGGAAEGVSFVTAFAFGDPNPPQKAPRPPRKPRATGNPPPRSGGHKCGAGTQDGSPCQRPVKTPSDHCWEHPGGKSTAKPKTGGKAPTKQSGGPKRTRKTAPKLPPPTTP